MRYKLPVDKLVNQLVPHFLSGRIYILYIQSILSPLEWLNERFILFAGEKQIEASMTSQAMYFEWYLNHKYKQYFVYDEDRIYIKDSQTLGVDLYHELSNYGRPCTIWYQNEQVNTLNNEEKPRAFYLRVEEKLINKVSFFVCVPEITIPQQEFVYMLSHTVNTYKLAGMTYLIKIDSAEFEPTKK